MINPFFKLELVSRHTEVQASALLTFADVFVGNNNNYGNNCGNNPYCALKKKIKVKHLKLLLNQLKKCL